MSGRKFAQSEELFLLMHSCSEKMKRFVAHKDKRRMSGLTINQIEIIHYIFREGEVSMGDIIDGLRVSKSAASQSVSGLIRRGYLRKWHDKKDARIVKICGTKKLLRVKSAVENIISTYIFPVFEGLSEKDRDSLKRILVKVQDGLERELS